MRLPSLALLALLTVAACAAESGKEASAPNRGTTPDGGGIDPGFEAGAGDDGGACSAIAARATNQLQPADIIIGVDGSGSMNEEVKMVREQINDFAKQIIDSGIDVRVIMLASYPNKVSLGPITVDSGICVPAPLGSGTCPKDHNPPHYLRPFEPAFGPFPEQGIGIGSTDMLNVFIDAWPKYRDWLRAEASLTYVGITDDDALAVEDGDRSKPLVPQINTAEKFISALAAILFGCKTRVR